MKRRRVTEDMSADEVEKFFGSLPRVVRELKQGKRVNRFLAVFTLAAFLLVSWRTEVQQDRLDNAADHDRRVQFDQCQVTNDNARALNQFLDVAVAAVKSNTTLTKAEREYRISLYQSIKQQLPICEAPQ